MKNNNFSRGLQKEKGIKIEVKPWRMCVSCAWCGAAALLMTGMVWAAQVVTDVVGMVVVYRGIYWQRGSNVGVVLWLWWWFRDGIFIAVVPVLCWGALRWNGGVTSLTTTDVVLPHIPLHSILHDRLGHASGTLATWSWTNSISRLGLSDSGNSLRYTTLLPCKTFKFSMISTPTQFTIQR